MFINSFIKDSRQILIVYISKVHTMNFNSDFGQTKTAISQAFMSVILGNFYIFYFSIILLGI